MWKQFLYLVAFRLPEHEVVRGNTETECQGKKLGFIHAFAGLVEGIACRVRAAEVRHVDEVPRVTALDQ